MESTEPEVPGKGSSNSYVGRFRVTDFPNHDNVGVLSQDLTQSTGEVKSDFSIHLRLIYPGNLVFDWILHSHNSSFGLVNASNEGSKGS